MAWTAPSTFVAGAILTAAQMNTNVRDNTLAGGPIYATTAARDAAITAPFVGQRAFISGTLINTQYNGTAWVEVLPIGTWTTFTPQLRTATTNIASTNNYGRYIVQGKTVTAQARVTATAVGVASGGLKLSMPTGTAIAGVGVIGTFFVTDAGTANYVGGAVFIETGYVSGQAYGSADAMGANTPAFTIAVGDVVSYSVTYEIS